MPYEYYRKNEQGALEKVFAPQTVLVKMPDGSIQTTIIDVEKDIFKIVREKGNRLLFIAEDSTIYYSLINLEEYENVAEDLLLTDTSNITNMSKVKYVDRQFLHLHAHPDEPGTARASMSRLCFNQLTLDDFLELKIAANNDCPCSRQKVINSRLQSLKRATKKPIRI